MHIRFALYILFGAITFIACSNIEKKQVSKDKNVEIGFWQEYISKISEYLPKKINSHDFWIVYRLGSVEYSNTATVLAIPKKSIADKKISCYYYSINMYEDHRESEPNLFSYEFVLTRDSLKHLPQINNLNKLNFSSLNNYINNRKHPNTGEWHCGNIFLINPEINSDFYVLDHNSPIEEKQFFLNLYRQISPSEYFQSFTLEKSCSDQQLLMNQLKSDYFQDSLKFKIKYDLPEYW